jgi:hypothetical protein
LLNYWTHWLAAVSELTRPRDLDRLDLSDHGADLLFQEEIMWFICATEGCICCYNNPEAAYKHEETTGHRVVFDGWDWEEQI